MKISLNALKKYVDIDIPTDELLRLIGSRLVEIEGTESLAEKYEGIKIVKVVECEKIPETHLSLCQIFDGEKNVQVVCGAPNVHEGMLAVWIMPGAIVPETFGNENFRLSVRKLRGYESNGMLSAADELGFTGADHDGIIEIDPKDAKPGDNFADVFDLNDIILDIENKSLTHRPDCFGLIGFAREIAGILGKQFVEPEFLYRETVFPEGFLIEKDGNLVAKDSKIKIEIEDEKICPRYTCAVLEIDDKYLEKGKYFTKNDVFLYKADMRPVSPIVDLTNILMLETGQPLHAFDYDKFVAIGGKENPEIIVRLAKTGEKLQLIDDKTVDLNENDILITSNNTPVALAGAMGGKNTEVDASTKKIILESATFSLYNLRKTQMAHGIFSEAITRFTKGQPASQTFNVLAEAIKRLDGSALDFSDNWMVGPKANVVKITTSDINSLLGTKYSKAEIRKCLENVSFKVEDEEECLKITAPCFRTDIHIKEDIIEEVGRLLGYDNIPQTLPIRNFTETELNPLLTLKTQIRNILSDKMNSHEVLTYSFVSQDLLEKVGEDSEDSYKIVNSISPELQRFRQSIVPSLIDKIRENLKAGFLDFSIYEMNQVTKKSLGLDNENVPIMKNHLGFVILGDYYFAKNALEKILDFLKIDRKALKIEENKNGGYFEPLHSAVLTINGKEIAKFGEIRTKVLKKFKLDSTVSAFEIDLNEILNLPKNTEKSFNISKFPSVARDLTLKVKKEQNYSELEQSITSVLEQEGLIYKTIPVSIYRPENENITKNVSFHLSFSNPKKTLDASEISAIIEKITKDLFDNFGAEVI